MSGGRRAGARPSPGLESPNPLAKAPTSDGATFRDLLIFEERLKQNAARLLRRKRKYQTTLVLLCAAILFLSYHVLLVPKYYMPLHYAQLALLVVCCTTLFLFFASGMYTERIVAANRFIPQANRALRPLNMYLNIRPPPKAPLWRRVLMPWTSAEDHALSKNAPRSQISPFTAGNASGQGLLVRVPASNEANGSSTPTVRRIQIPPIPPSTNPRGEIIFSNRVSPAFREGYERYRNAFERRRREKLEAAMREASWSWPSAWLPTLHWFLRLLAHMAWWRFSRAVEKMSDQEKCRAYSLEGGSNNSTSNPLSTASRASQSAAGVSRRGYPASRSRSDSTASSASASSTVSTASGASRGSRRVGDGSPRTRASDLVGEHRPGADSSRRSSTSSISSLAGGDEGVGQSQGGSKARPSAGTRQSGGTSSTRKTVGSPNQQILSATAEPRSVYTSMTAANLEERSDSEATLREPIQSGGQVPEDCNEPLERQSQPFTPPQDDASTDDVEAGGSVHSSEGGWIEVV